MELKKCLLTKNDCYKTAQKITPKGIIVHSTGANNPNLKRYVQPDDGLLGTNPNNNDWNRSGLQVCVHAFIGKDKNGNVQVYQTLPFNYACWGCGNGSKGSYNYNPAYIQFEICEDDLTNKDYFNKCFKLAAEFCVYLMKEYNIPIENVVSHHEAHNKGYASNHGDCDHWLAKFGKTMNDFRNDVKTLINGGISPTPVAPNIPATPGIEYRVHLKGGTWLDWVSKADSTSEGYAGIWGKAIDGIQVKDKNYQAHTLGGAWLSEVAKVDNTDNGYAGIYGKSIDGIKVKNAMYRVHIKNGEWLPWVSKVDSTSDGYAGLYGKEIDGVQIKNN